MTGQLEDREAIRELLAEYCFLLDGYQLAEFSRLFTEDGAWISRNGEATGPKDIEALLRRLVPEPVPGKRRKHFTTNIIIKLTGDEARVKSNFLVVRDSEDGPVIAVAGTYEDHVVRVGAGWKFRSRRLFHDVAGESGLNDTGSAPGAL